MRRSMALSNVDGPEVAAAQWSGEGFRDWWWRWLLLDRLLQVRIGLEWPLLAGLEGSEGRISLQQPLRHSHRSNRAGLFFFCGRLNSDLWDFKNGFRGQPSVRIYGCKLLGMAIGLLPNNSSTLSNWSGPLVMPFIGWTSSTIFSSTASSSFVNIPDCAGPLVPLKSNRFIIRYRGRNTDSSPSTWRLLVGVSGNCFLLHSLSAHLKWRTVKH